VSALLKAVGFAHCTRTIQRTAYFVKHWLCKKTKCLIFNALRCILTEIRNFFMNTEGTDNKPNSFGEGLKMARELRKLSLREVEEATGISNAYISQLENDKIKKPSPHFLHKLASLYDIGYELLMESAGYVKRKTPDGPKTLAGAALFAEKKLTSQEEEALAEYLAFLRSKRK
jgi:transcriptional regulator with XRE-family HTH domain